MRAIKVNRYLLPILAVAALLGSVAVAKAAGAWQTSGRGEVMLDEGGRPDPAGIKGWMTLEGVVDTYGVPLDWLVQELGLPAGVDPHLAMRDLAEQFGVEVWAVREAVAAYQAEQ